MRNARRILVTAAAVALIVAGIGFLTATTAASPATADLSIGASVANNCTATAGSVAFGAYDPVVTNASSNLDASGTFTVSCTKNAAGVRVDLGLGLNDDGASHRRMTDGTDFLTYELYSDAGRTTVWGEGAGGGSGKGVAYSPASKAAHTFTAYGRVASGQDVQAGDYADTVVASVNF